jgi:hypothetical protein
MLNWAFRRHLFLTNVDITGPCPFPAQCLMSDEPLHRNDDKDDRTGHPARKECLEAAKIDNLRCPPRVP